MDQEHEAWKRDVAYPQLDAALEAIDRMEERQSELAASTRPPNLEHVPNEPTFCVLFGRVGEARQPLTHDERMARLEMYSEVV